jgi:hypothetical protein
LRTGSPQVGEYNPLQKAAYTGVFFILTPLILLSGLAMSPQMNVAFNWLPAMFGGRQSARSFHFILTFLFVLFTFGHVFMVSTTGVFNNMRSMVTGWYREKIPGQDTMPPSDAEAPLRYEEERPTTIGVETSAEEVQLREPEPVEPSAAVTERESPSAHAEKKEEIKDGEK